MPTPPTLTQEQRREAYDKSLQLRRERAQLKASLSAGDTNIYDAWLLDVAQGMKVYDLLTALPGVGPAKAKGYMLEAGIPHKNAVRTCGPRQVERLFELLR